MSRVLFASLFCVATLAVPAVPCGEKADKKVQRIKGKFKSYKDGTLVLDVNGKEMTFKVAPDFKVSRVNDGRTRHVAAGKFFAHVRANHRIHIKTEDGKVTYILDGVVWKK